MSSLVDRRRQSLAFSLLPLTFVSRYALFLPIGCALPTLFFYTKATHVAAREYYSCRTQDLPAAKVGHSSRRMKWVNKDECHNEVSQAVIYLQSLYKSLVTGYIQGKDITSRHRRPARFIAKGGIMVVTSHVEQSSYLDGLIRLRRLQNICKIRRLLQAD